MVLAQNMAQIGVSVAAMAGVLIQLLNGLIMKGIPSLQELERNCVDVIMVSVQQDMIARLMERSDA